MRRALVLLAATLLGCATVGRNFDATSLGWLHPGETTRQELLANLGQPLRVGSDSGDSTWTYGYYQYRLVGDSNNKDLVVRFLPDGKVKSFTLNTTFPDEKRKLEPVLPRAG